MSKTQMSLKAHFNVVRKRKGDHGIVKRRKIDERTREEIITEQTDPDEINIIKRRFVNNKVAMAINTPCLHTPINKSPFKAPSSPIKVSLSTLHQSPMKPPPSSPITAKQCQSPRKPPQSPRKPPQSPRKPPPSPITARQCQSPRKLPSSPYRFETRGAAALRIALEKTKRTTTQDPSSLPATTTSDPSSLPVDSTTAPSSLPVASTIAPSTPSKSILSSVGQPLINDSPKLEKFEIFEFTSPQRKPRSSRRLKYAMLTEQTPAEMKLKKTAAATSNSINNGVSTLKKKQPAYQRLSCLVSEPPSSPIRTIGAVSSETKPVSPVVNLVLPYNYQLLVEKFKAIDSVCSMLHRRNEICTFDKIKQSVQSVTRRNFAEKDLAQIQFVYPEAYILRQEKNIPGINNKLKYLLTIQCTDNEGEIGGVVKRLPTGKGLIPAVLVKRINTINERLLNIVSDHHKDYLASLDPPIKIENDKLYRWHVDFELESIPDVPEGQLPKPPTNESYSTAKAVLNVTKDKLLEKVANSESHTNSSKPVPPAPLNPLLKGVSSALLERIREKETARIRADMTRDPIKDRQVAMVTRLPAMCRMIRSIFICEKKSAILLDDVTRKIKESHSSGLGENEIEEHIWFLIEIQKETWIENVYIRKKNYLKMKNINMSMKEMIQSLETKREELKGFK